MEGNTTIEDLLSKIDEQETKIKELESKVTKLSTDNEEIRSFNRTLLTRRVETKPATDSDEAKELLAKYLKED